MDQRLLLAIVLSMLVLVGYYYVFPPPAPPERPVPEAGVTQEKDQPQPPQPEEQAGAAARQPGATVTADRAAPAVAPRLEAPTEGKIVHVETPLYTAEFDTRGGWLRSLELKHYLKNKPNISWGQVLPFLDNVLPGFLKSKEPAQADFRQHVQMVKRERPQDEMFSLRFVGEDSLTRTFQDVIFTADENAARIDSSQGQPVTLSLTGAGPDGLTLVKRWTFHPDDYIIEFSLSVINYGGQEHLLRAATLFGEGPDSGDDVSYRQSAGPIWHEEGDLETEDADDIEGQLIVREPEWLGISDTYFITATQPTTPIDHAFYESEEVTRGDSTKWVAAYGVELPQVALQPNKLIASDYRLYVGPKKSEEMAKFGADLEQSLDLSLDILAQPMLALMRWFHSIVGNWGVAIILLTVVVRVLLFPLTYKGMVNIKRMQKLQPKMKALREKFKDDKERLNKEMMQMYKRYKMNPLGGCLPIAFQIPIFFALYSALLGAIELRHTEFAWWITDLSAKDGLYVLPLLMGASMFLQMRLSPSSPDPTQAKIMQFMPLVFTLFMFQFPSGLVLYWLTSNVLSILQQVIINRVHIPEPAED